MPTIIRNKKEQRKIHLIYLSIISGSSFSGGVIILPLLFTTILILKDNKDIDTNATLKQQLTNIFNFMLTLTIFKILYFSIYKLFENSISESYYNTYRICFNCIWYFFTFAYPIFMIIHTQLTQKMYLYYPKTILFFKAELNKNFIHEQSESQRLKKNILTNSPIYKELKQLIKYNMSNSTKKEISSELWGKIEKLIFDLYPDYKTFITEHSPNIGEQEWLYSCLYLFGLDSSELAILLNISPASVRTKNMRLRKRLNIQLKQKQNLYSYIMERLK